MKRRPKSYQSALLHFRSTAEDKEIVMAEIKEAFGVDAELPEEFKSSTIEGVARMVEAAREVRHGICVVGTTDVDATIAAIDAATKSESIIVEGDAVSLCAVHGAFTAVFKAAMKKTSSVNICVKTPLDAATFEPLNSVLDDNKKLCLSNGEVLQMTSHMRVILFEKDCSRYAPAAVSRLGFVYADCAAPIGLHTAEEKLVKVDFQGNVMRLRLNISKKHTSIYRSFVEDLQKMVAASYGWDSSATFSLKYYDDEGDLCTLTKETAADALALQAGASGALKLVVIV